MAENKDAGKAENKNVKNEKEKPSKEKNNGEGGQGGLKSLKELLTSVWKEYPRIAASVSAVILGGLAFWEGYGQWWFGFDLPLWIYFVLPASLLVIWLFAFCGYYREAHPEQKIEGKEKLRSLSWNIIVMITIPVLVIGILLDRLALKWRDEEMIVILIEPFEKVESFSEDSTSENEINQNEEEINRKIAKEIKSCIEKACPFSERHHHRIRVVIGKKPKEKSEELLLSERAMKYRADMILSGWYTDLDSEIQVCYTFKVVHPPLALPAIFRGRGDEYPQTFIINKAEIENFAVRFTLGSLLGYEGILTVGAGAYASRDWQRAEGYFRGAFEMIETIELSEKCPKIAVQKVNRKFNENLKGDKALIQVYIGHCLMNQSKYENAILRYDKAIEAGMKIPPSDMRYGEILTSAYLGRGIAYRQKNKFELATQDFQTVGEHFSASLRPKPLLAEESRFLSGDREILKIGARTYYCRGEKYLIQKEYKHAQAYLEMSAEFYRTLMRGMPTPIQEEYSLELARSLVRLGEIHNRLAFPQLTDDENNKRAIKYLDEAISLTRKFGNQKDQKMLKIRAVGLRHLGEAYRSKDKIEDVEIAFKYHKEAKEIWGKTMEPNKPEGVANELVRIGNVHRRLEDLLHKPNNEEYTNLESAIDVFRLSVKMLASVNDDGYRMLFYSVPNNSLDPNSIRDLRKLVKDHVKDEITAHHLANSLRNLAETKLWVGGDPNMGDLPTIRKLLDFATECYEKTICKMEVEEDPNWIEKIRINERNQSLKDDLGWCMTLHGYALLKYALLKKGSGEAGNKLYYETLEDKLKKAMRYFEESGNYKKDKDKSEIITNLLILSITQVKLNQKDKARETFSEGCLRLRNLTRKAKKVWYIDYIRDLMRDFRQEYPIKSVDHDTYFSDLEEWLEADTVKKGRYALDKIMEGIEKKFEEGGED